MSDDEYSPARKSKRRSLSPMPEEMEEEPETFSLASLGLQRVGTAPPPKPKPQPTQPIQMLNARGMPARIRKRNRFFFDDELINDDKPLRMSLSPRKAPASHSTPLKAAANNNAGSGGGNSSNSTNNSPSTRATPTLKVLKKRKGVASRYMRFDGEKKSSPKAVGVQKKSGNNSTNEAASNSKAMPKQKIKSETAAAVAAAVAATAEVASSAQESPAAADVSFNKKLAQRIGLRLRNVLKLPKAHKWVIYEWFYSYIDKALFQGRNDFQMCLNDVFANLHDRGLKRYEWQRIRSLFGKPRRCSSNFFEQERRELERKRQKVRFMQARKSGEIKDANYLRELPEKIPLPLPLGTKVTARLRVPQDGVFSGTVNVYESLTSSYRVTFERAGLGTHSVPDFEIVSENFFEMLPLHSLIKDFRPNLMSLMNGSAGSNASSGPWSNFNSTLRYAGARNLRSALNMHLNKSDPLLGQEQMDSPIKNSLLGRDNINGIPVKLLNTIIHVKRVLAVKSAKLQRLADMNNEAELKVSKSSNEPYESDDSQYTGMPMLRLNEDFQRRYASIVVSIEKVNFDMQQYLNSVQSYLSELTRDPHVQAMLAPSYLREQCREEAEEAVNRNNTSNVKHKGILGLLKNLATLLMVASHLNNDGNIGQVNKVLEGCLEEVRSGIHNVNMETFQKNVQLHLHHIRCGVGQMVANMPPAQGR